MWNCSSDCVSISPLLGGLFVCVTYVLSYALFTESCFRLHSGRNYSVYLSSARCTSRRDSCRHLLPVIRLRLYGDDLMRPVFLLYSTLTLLLHLEAPAFPMCLLPFIPENEIAVVDVP